MLHRRDSFKKYTALFVALLLLANPVSALAAEEELMLLEESEAEPSVPSHEDSASDSGNDIDTEAIYNSIDVEKLRESIDIDELMAQIDEDELRAQIDEDELREELARRQAEKESHRENQEIETGTIDLLPEKQEELPKGVTRIEFPIIENNEIFDFIMDPMGLVFLTNAAKYGGGNVQESATILFRNTDSEYLFSDTSDYLTFRNKGNVPVKVTVKATIINEGNLEVTSDKSFSGMSDPAIYLALTDNEGNEIPLSAEGETTIETVLNGSLQGGVYKWNSETGSYEFTESENHNNSGAYHFALTGACNKEGNWGKVSARPTVKVCWSARTLDDEDIDEMAKEAQEKAEEPTDITLESLEEEPSGDTLELLEAENSESTEKTDEAPSEKRLTLEEAMLEELRNEKLQELKQQKLEELIEERLKELIEEEFERLYREALKSSGN
ncbi:hypothetical protein [Butyrivibrio sp. MC2021]|uniref:hypothetical protein n=1 Tax=Butyrivibrio sp. MC2021 TaxID=1408306 RepID=UPI00047D9DC9|nr:hypothetical protein [Butyrivibrio sp. MC2021]